MIDRRRLLRQAVGTVVSGVVIGSALSRNGAARAGMRVIVRQAGGIVAVDARSGNVTPLDERFDITSATDPGIRTPEPAHEFPSEHGLDGSVDYWISSIDGSAHLFRLETDVELSWWWQKAGEVPVPVALSSDLETAFPTGHAGQWFHGASVDAAHLGTGTLCLMAVETATGTLVLDWELDRRLELAATSVSDGGAVVGHVQGGNTQVEMRVVDLRSGPESVAVKVDVQPARAAASAIDLRVTEDGESALAVAGLSWSAPGDPESMVIIVSSDSIADPAVTEIPGELIGLVAQDFTADALPASARP